MMVTISAIVELIGEAEGEDIVPPGSVESVGERRVNFFEYIGANYM